MNRPAVLLLDEPLGALDLKLRKQMQVELKGIQREVGITFLYVTHDQEEALAMSDRIAVMEDGEVRQCGTPEEVYERPGGPFVAGFIGISNLLPGDARTAACGSAERLHAVPAAARVPSTALGAPREDLARRARGGHGRSRARSSSASTWARRRR